MGVSVIFVTSMASELLVPSVLQKPRRVWVQRGSPFPVPPGMRGRERVTIVTCDAHVAEFMDSQTFPLRNSRMKSSETCPSLAMLDLTVSLTSWSTSLLPKDSVSTSCVLVSESSIGC